MNPSTLKRHPLAEKLNPFATQDIIDGITESIRENGLFDAITLYEGKILDGAIRNAACLKAGVAPRYDEFKGDNIAALNFVAARIMRRSLSKSQKACSAVGYYEEYRSMRVPLKYGSLKGKRAERTAEIVAKIFGINDHYIHLALRLKKADPKLFSQVMQGEIALTEVGRKCFGYNKKDYIPKSERDAFEKFKQLEAQPPKITPNYRPPDFISTDEEAGRVISNLNEAGWSTWLSGDVEGFRFCIYGRGRRIPTAEEWNRSIFSLFLRDAVSNACREVFYEEKGVAA